MKAAITPSTSRVVAEIAQRYAEQLCETGLPSSGGWTTTTVREYWACNSKQSVGRPTLQRSWVLAAGLPRIPTLPDSMKPSARLACLACAILSVLTPFAALALVASGPLRGGRGGIEGTSHTLWHQFRAGPTTVESLPLPRQSVRRAAALSSLRMVAAPDRTSTEGIEVGSAPLDWADLGFQYRDVNCHVKFTFRKGDGWSEGELVKEPFVKVHIANTALHYGQAVFEGLKAFQCKDGSVRIFRPDENAKRIRNSAERILMEPPPADLFVKACKMAVTANLEFVPPYGSQGALYLRPLLFGSDARIGLQPSDEYTLLVMAIPVGNYYKGGPKATTAVVMEDYDRAAPKGVGHVKVAGNYAADMLPNMMAKQAGYPIGLYLDAKTNTLVEEFSTSNFCAVTHDNKFVTPDSPAILPSITNKSLMELAEDMGMVVERRPVPLTEVGSFKEVAACGTAVVMTSIKQIVAGGEVIKINDASDDMGPVCKVLYDRVRAVQAGEAEDKFGWMEPV